jgi:hypothetical protein
VHDVSLVEQDVHGTAQGVADETFFAPFYRYLAKTRPPIQAVAAVDFMHAVAAWDFPAASRGADRLGFEAGLGEAWVPRESYHDGAVVAKLALGDVAGARRVYDELAPVLDDGSSLRARLLEAHLRAAETRPP